MKNIKRIIFGIIFSVLIFLLVYLYINGVIIVKNEFENLNLVIYISLFILFLYYLVFYVIRPTYIKYFKVINTLIGLLIIYISQYYVINSGPDGIFFGDILCLIGVFLTIIGPTNALASKKELKEKDLEIIEA